MKLFLPALLSLAKPLLIDAKTKCPQSRLAARHLQMMSHNVIATTTRKHVKSLIRTLIHLACVMERRTFTTFVWGIAMTFHIVRMESVCSVMLGAFLGKYILGGVVLHGQLKLLHQVH